MDSQTPNDTANPMDQRLAKRVKLSEGNEEVALALSVIDSANDIIARSGKLKTDTNSGGNLRHNRMLDQGEKLYDVGLRMLEEVNMKIEAALKDEVTTPVPVQKEESQKTSSAGSERTVNSTLIEAQSVREDIETTSKDTAITPVATHEDTALETSSAEPQDTDTQITTTVDSSGMTLQIKPEDAADKPLTTLKVPVARADTANVQGVDLKVMIAGSDIKNEKPSRKRTEGSTRAISKGSKIVHSFITSSGDEDENESLFHPETSTRSKSPSRTTSKNGTLDPFLAYIGGREDEEEARLGTEETEDDYEGPFFSEPPVQKENPRQDPPSNPNTKKRKKKTNERSEDDRCETCHKLLGLGKRSRIAGPMGGPQCISCNNRRKRVLQD